MLVLQLRVVVVYGRKFPRARFLSSLEESLIPKSSPSPLRRRLEVSGHTLTPEVMEGDPRSSPGLSPENHAIVRDKLHYRQEYTHRLTPVVEKKRLWNRSMKTMILL